MTALADMVGKVQSPQVERLQRAATEYITGPGADIRSASQDLDVPATARLVKAGHAVIWMRSTTIEGRSPLRTAQVPSMPRLIAELCPHLTYEEATVVGATINKCLVMGNLMARRRPKGAVVIRPWPEVGTSALQAKIERPYDRIKADTQRLLEEAGLAVRPAPAVEPSSAPPTRPGHVRDRAAAEAVARSYDAAVLDLPEPNPTAVMAYLERLQGVLLAVCSDLARSREEGSAWQAVVDKAEGLGLGTR